MVAPMFPVNTHRLNPYLTFRFQVLIDGQPVAGLSKMTALKKTTEQVKWRAAGDPSHEHVMPGKSEYSEVSLNQGLTHDPVFEEWANRVNNIDGDAGMSLRNFRRDIVVNLLNLQGQVVISYKLFRAWVSEFQALPDLDANDTNTVGIQTITIQHEGWQRDTAVTEPVES